MSRRQEKKAARNPQRVARFRKEAEQRLERWSLQLVWSSLLLFDIFLVGYSIRHYIDTRHNEVLLYFIVVAAVTGLAVVCLPFPKSNG